MNKFGLLFAFSAAFSLSACSSAGSGDGRDAAGGASGNDAGQTTGSGGSASGSGGSASGSGGSGGSSTGGATGSGGTGSGGASGSGGTAPGTDAGSAGNDAGTADTGGAGSAWPAVTDFAARGPFPIQREMNVGPAGAYDIVRPMQLGAEGRKHPIVSWNNGTLYLIARYQNMLDHWASHGFVVMGGHTNTTAGGAIHKGAIDWLVAENARTGSAYFGKLDVKKIGAVGHSQGGGASISAGSGLPMPAGIITTMPLMPIMSYQRAEFARQAGTMLIISATQDDRSNTVADQGFADVTKEFVDAQFKGVHEDAMNPGIHGATVGWLRYQLMGDTTAKALFYPAGTCGLCRDAAWMRLRHKNSPP